MYNQNSIYVLHKQTNCKGFRKFRYPFAFLIQWMAHQSGHPKDLPNPNHTAGLYFYNGNAYIFESLGNGVVNRSYKRFLEFSKKEDSQVWLEEAFEVTPEQLNNLVNAINELLEKKAKYDVKKAIKSIIHHNYNTALSKLLKGIIKLVLGKTKDSEINFFCTEVFQFITKLAYNPKPSLLRKADISITKIYPPHKTSQPHRILGFFCRDKKEGINVKEALQNKSIIKIDLSSEIPCIEKNFHGQ